MNMTTDAQKKASKKYESEKIESIKLRLPKGKKELVQRCAQLNNESINGMVNRLLDEELLKQGFSKKD